MLISPLLLRELTQAVSCLNGRSDIKSKHFFTTLLQEHLFSASSQKYLRYLISGSQIHGEPQLCAQMGTELSPIFSEKSVLWHFLALVSNFVQRKENNTKLE